MILRNYQEKIAKDVLKFWEKGNHVLVQLGTGGGKTAILCECIKRYNKKTLVIAHTDNLISQISVLFARNKMKHDVISSKKTRTAIIKVHFYELNNCYVDPRSSLIVASIDTLIRRNIDFGSFGLVVYDEGHHVLQKNKWGKILKKCNAIKSLHMTATPTRSDGAGLGIDHDGFIEHMIQGPTVAELMDQGYLCQYKAYAPTSSIDLTTLKTSKSGDYTDASLRTASEKSHITGDIVENYIKFANGKLGITFCTDIKTVEQVTRKYNEAGIPAKMITASTDPLIRSHTMQQFRNREILQLVNVNILGEGVDVPGVEVVSMARPTKSITLYLQQIGRALRCAPDKKHAIIIDHVNNIMTLGPPDLNRNWSLSRIDKRSSVNQSQELHMTRCKNPDCFALYISDQINCPYCGSEPQKKSHTRDTSLEVKEGVLSELDIKSLLKSIDKKINPPNPPRHLSNGLKNHIVKKQEYRRDLLIKTQELIASYAGLLKEKFHYNDNEIHKQFHKNFGMTILEAQAAETSAQIGVIRRMEFEIHYFKDYRGNLKKHAISR